MNDNASSGAEVELTPEVYKVALEAQRAEKDDFFKHSPYGPIEERAKFTGLNYYPADLAFRYILPLHKADEQEVLTFQTNTGDEQLIFYAVCAPPFNAHAYINLEQSG